MYPWTWQGCEMIAVYYAHTIMLASPREQNLINMGVIQYGHPLRPRMGMGFLNSPNMRQDIT